MNIIAILLCSCYTYKIWDMYVSKNDNKEIYKTDIKHPDAVTVKYFRDLGYSFLLR